MHNKCNTDTIEYKYTHAVLKIPTTFYFCIICKYIFISLWKNCEDR